MNFDHSSASPIDFCGQAISPDNSIVPALELGNSQARNLVFIDSQLADLDELVRGFSDAKVFLLDPHADGIAQIGDILSGYRNLASIQVVSHGSEGDIALGNSHLNLNNLDRLQAWHHSLAEGADLLFYGCNIGAGTGGAELVRAIGQITGADVAASNDVTGNAARGGNWVLETQIGSIETPTAEILGYRGILPIYNGKDYRLTGSAKSWEQAQAEAQSLGGNLVTINDATEETWLKQTFGNTETLWIGLTDRAVEGNFQWVNGETTAYRNWAPGEPNDYKFGGAFPGGEDYGAMNFGSQKQWNDFPDSYGGTYRGIIEIPTTPTNPVFTFNNKDYRLTSGNKSWEQAQAEAQSLGGNLVTINDAAEETWLKQTFSANEVLWIGLNDRAVEGNFQWVNGETTTYRNWAPGEPNDYKFGGAFPGGEDYGAMNFGSQKQWNDFPDSYGGTYRGIIEIPKTTATNSTIGLRNSVFQVDETGGKVSITVDRQQSSEGTVSVDYRTFDATATAGRDYTAVSGRLTFAPGETSKTIDISIFDDTLLEGNESFNLTIDNPIGNASLLAPRTATVTIVDDEAPSPLFSFPNFGNTVDLALNGDATQVGNNLRLTADASNRQGSAFLKKPLAIADNTSFSTRFQFQLTGGLGTNGADGFTFVLQNNNIAKLGNTGGGLGYAGIGRSLAIEFDTYQNSYDANNNHISILRNGNVESPLATVAASLDLNGGQVLTAWVDYDSDTDNLQVYLANTLAKPATAILTTQIDLANLLGDRAFLGFSGGTGGLTNAQEIQNWSFSSNSSLLPEPPPPTIQKQTTTANLNQPTAIDWTPDGAKMFIAEKGGLIKVVENGQTLTTPFIDLRDRVNSPRDRGLLDIAVHPDFFNGKPYVYALYTYDPPEAAQNTSLAGIDGIGNRASRLTRITADAATNYTTAVAGSEVVILGKNSTWNNFNAFVNSTVDLNQPAAGILPDGTNLQDFLNVDSESHAIGSVEFGKDGALYVSNGDGASYNQVDPRATRVQDIDNLSGKILRIDPMTGQGLADNPFYNGDANSNRSKVYQYGLRNPFRISVQPGTGQVFVGDVGWTQWEEINAAPAGANFGWPYYEGGNGTSLKTGSYQDLPAARAFYASGQPVRSAILGLNHAAEGINAIVLGGFYTGNSLPSEYQGDLLFNDLGQGIVRNISFDASGKIAAIDTFATDARYVVHIAQAPDGNLYYVDLDDGVVGRWVIG